MNMRTHFEIKAAGDDEDELKAALADLTKTTTDALAAMKKSLEAETGRADGLELKLNRLLLNGGVSEIKAGTVDQLKLQEEYKAIASFVRSGGHGDAAEMKSLSVGTDPDGGYLVLPQRSTVMTQRLFEESPIRRLSRVITMNTGDVFEEPIDKDEAQAVWVGEKTARPETTTPQVGLLSIPLYEVYANPKATQKILDTSYLDVGAWLEGKINDRFARTDAAAYVSGDGLKQPSGILTGTFDTTDDYTRAWGTLQYTKTTNASAFPASNPADILKTLAWSLRAPYRRGAVWLMNSQTASTIDKFKDGQGNYIWQNGMTSGAPPSLLGYPVEFDENMPNIGANAYPIAFGNFKLGYTIIERPGLKLLRDPYTDKPNVMFYAYRRVGGDVNNSDAIKLLKCEA